MEATTYTKTNETRDGGSMRQIDKTWHSLRHVGRRLSDNAGIRVYV